MFITAKAFAVTRALAPVRQMYSQPRLPSGKFPDVPNITGTYSRLPPKRSTMQYWLQSPAKRIGLSAVADGLMPLYGATALFS